MHRRIADVIQQMEVQRILTEGEVGAPLNRLKPSRIKAVLLLWTINVISVLFCHAFMRVCLLMPCGHLLGKGWPLGSGL